jgi:hypothetical protein
MEHRHHIQTFHFDDGAKVYRNYRVDAASASFETEIGSSDGGAWAALDVAICPLGEIKALRDSVGSLHGKGLISEPERDRLLAKLA